MKKGTLKFGRTTLEDVLLSDNEIGEVLIGVKDICKRQNLDRTSNAIGTALNILYYEMRANSGQIKFAQRASAKSSALPKTASEKNGICRLEKLANLRNHNHL